ncbi:MAG: hypothetical protein JNK77_01025 [Saprospiraceae bacterium]|nr:hypothetical protein [Saprospiraceae bacterium]
MKTNVYLIRTLTNMHPGSGDSGYGVVDKLVQRDPATGYPVIHMSGIKGALRQFFEEKLGKTAPLVKTIFGSTPQENAEDVSQGELRFLSADVLAMPAPNNESDDNDSSPFHLYCHPIIVASWLDKVKIFAGKFVNLDDTGWVQDGAIFHQVAMDLPVIARNYLDNGESKNLWYEEVVPRETRFGCIIQGPESILNAFHTEISGKVIQLGGNATVGYGYCLFDLQNLKA